MLCIYLLYINHTYNGNIKSRIQNKKRIQYCKDYKIERKLKKVT